MTLRSDLDDDGFPVPPFGHNRPPVLTEEEIAQFAKRRDELIAAVDDLRRSPPREMQTMQKCVELCKMMAAFCDTLEEARKKAKQPSLDAGRLIDGEFSNLSSPVAKLISEIKQPLLEFMELSKLEKIRTELGALASIRTNVVLESYDRRKLDLEALRNFLDGDAIEKAIRAFIKMTGKAKLRGAKIGERQSVTIR